MFGGSRYGYCSRDMACSSNSRVGLGRVCSKRCTHCAALLNASILTSFDAGLQQVKSFTLLAYTAVQVFERNAVFQSTRLDEVPRRDSLVMHDQTGTEAQRDLGIVREKVMGT